MSFTPQPRNVILISIDTLRADHIGCYGYARPTSPHVDRLASEGVRFANYFANAGWTMPQHFTLLTGMYPQTHDMIRIVNNRRLAPRLTTLTQVLKGHGYRTQGFLSENKFLDPRLGYDRGFDHLQWGPGRNRHTPMQTEQVVNWLRQEGGKGKFFLFIHNDDCHEPFDPPEEFDCFGNELIDRFDGKILYFDHYLARWIETLKETGLAEKTILLLSSDHGTEFFEDGHGFVGKTCSLYNSVLRCLLVVWAPGMVPGRRAVEGLTETAQLPNTILELLGLPAKADAQGTSFAPLLFEDGDGLPHVCSHTLRNGNVQIPAYEHHAIQTRDTKLIRTRLKAPFNPVFFHQNWIRRLRAQVKRLGLSPRCLRWGGVMRESYDLIQDPGETSSRTCSTESPCMLELERLLDAWMNQGRAFRKALLNRARHERPGA